ncbi:MAG TPA: zf-HC2 domain-containing protein [Kofleriaceae bacterium]
MSLCESIDTLAMAYLDDELASEERRELDTHLTECVACRKEIDGARADQQLIQTSLVAPRATDTMRMRMVKALDLADKESTQIAVKAQRKRFSQWMLPGTAMLAAAAAIVVFVGVNMKSGDRASSMAGSVSRAGLKQESRALPLEVQGASTGAWVRQFAAVEPPHMPASGSQLLGARMFPGGVNGHDGTLLSYQITFNSRPAVLSVLVIDDVRPEELSDGEEVDAGGRMVRVVQSDGKSVVTCLDGQHRGYMFMSDELPVADLISLVGRTSLVGKQ